MKQWLKATLRRHPFTRWARLTLNHRDLKPSLRRQLGWAGVDRQETGRGPRILVPLIETSHYQFYQLLIVAKALQLRGADVRVLLCGSLLPACEIKSARNTDADPCLACRFNQRSMLPHYGLETHALGRHVAAGEVARLRKLASRIAEDYPDRYLHRGVNVIPMTNDSVTRYYYGAVPENPETLTAIREKFLATALIGVEISHNIHETWNPDIVLGQMNVYADWAPYFKYFEQRNKQTNLISISPFNYNAVVFDSMKLYDSPDRYERFLAQRGDHPLTPDERLRLSAITGERFSLKAQTFVDMKCFEADQDVRRILRIDPKKRNIFLFSNVFWDIGISELGTLFDGVIAWVLETIDLLREQPGVHLYIKPHPAEKFDASPSMRGVVEAIRERYPVLPSNVTLIVPELKISPYELFPYIDLGVVYNGTVGLEMLMHDIPLVVGGAAPYSNLGFGHEPSSVGAYRAALLGIADHPRPAREAVELFAYFYFVKTLIPWTLTHRAYAHQFDGYRIESLDDLLPGRDAHVDHLCDCVLRPADTVVEAWN